MAVTFVSYSNKISASDAQAAHNRLYTKSQTYRNKIDAINSSGENVTVAITDGESMPDPTPSNSNRPDLYASTDDSDTINPNSNTIVISEQFLQEIDYVTDQQSGASGDQTLERVLAHELGGHSWQDSEDLPMSGPDAEDEATDIENDIMSEAFGEAPRDGYDDSSVFSDPSQASTYDDNGNKIR